MTSNTLGTLFRITNWGESHGKAIGVVIDGCPSLLELTESDIQQELDRRKPGQNKLTTQRKESDHVQILSGVFEGKTTGAPISLLIENKDQRSKDYKNMETTYRPSHSDYTFDQKYGIRDPHGGGRTSARITAGHVAAGAVAQKILGKIEIVAYVKSIKDISSSVDLDTVSRKDVDGSLVRCPDMESSLKMEKLIESAKKDGDSVGGIIECVVKNMPVGLGSPVFDKLEADLSKAMMCINATKGFEIGSGFSGTTQFGSEHNDPFVLKGNKVQTTTNNSGGVQGGISNGMPLVFRVAFKPTSTIAKEQQTVSKDKKETTLAAKGRHDPCVLPRAVPIVEALTAIVLCDHYLQNKTVKHHE